MDEMTREVSKKILSRLRWHAERGANGFEDRKPQDAAENAQMRLEAIVQLLDEIDDMQGHERSRQIFAVFSGAPGLSPRVK